MPRIYSRQYLINLRSELKWLKQQFANESSHEARMAIAGQILKVKEKLGPLAEATPNQLFHQQTEEIEKLLKEMEEALPKQLDAVVEEMKKHKDEPDTKTEQKEEKGEDLHTGS
jgi:ABC-type transport system involved in cytochrome bd biosynthesis fused ATPase/permease subunit